MLGGFVVFVPIHIDGLAKQLYENTVENTIQVSQTMRQLQKQECGDVPPLKTPRQQVSNSFSMNLVLAKAVIIWLQMHFPKAN